jgi:hypothetical protein
LQLETWCLARACNLRGWLSTASRGVAESHPKLSSIAIHVMRSRRLAGREMRSVGRKCGGGGPGWFLAVVLSLALGIGGFIPLGPFSGLLVSEAHADGRKNRAGRVGKRPTSQQPGPQQAVQQLQAIQQLRAAQQAAATAQKLQQVQSTIAAQQQHVQRLQQMVAAAKAARKPATQVTTAPSATVPVASVSTTARISHQKPHQALIQRALSQVQSSRQVSTPQATVQNRIQAMRNTIAKVRGYQPSTQAARGLPSGKHHQALLQSISARIRQPGLSSSLRPSGFNAPRVKQHAVFAHVLSKLRGPALQGPHQVRQQLVFKHIHGKLSHRFKKKTDPAPTRRRHPSLQRRLPRPHRSRPPRPRTPPRQTRCPSFLTPHRTRRSSTSSNPPLRRLRAARAALPTRSAARCRSWAGRPNPKNLTRKVEAVTAK